MTYVQDRTASALTLAPQQLFGGGAAPRPSFRLDPLTGDGATRFEPPWSGDGSSQNTSPLTNFFNQMLAALQQFFSAMGFGAYGLPQQTYYTDAQASSLGDPHLRFDGTSNGASETTAFDSMTSHADLLSSDSFAGGYRLSTRVTQPAENGVTYNERATVTTDFGRTRIALDRNGSATIDSYGQTQTLAPGQSLTLGDGTRVSRANDGSLSITCQNAQGGSITTTMRQNGNGVDVSAQAHDVDLSGDLAAAAAAAPNTSQPLRVRY